MYSVCNIRGGRYGGSSKLNVEASPFKTDLDNPQETTKLNPIPRIAIKTTAAADANPARYGGTKPPIKIVAIRI